MSIVNCDLETGIHFGVIALRSIAPESWDELTMGPDSTDLSWEYSKEEFLSRLMGALSEETKDERVESLIDELEELWPAYRDNGRRRRDAAMEIADLYEDELPDKEDVWDIVSDRFGDCYQCDNPDWEYEGGGYKVQKCLDFDACVLKSPFFTFAPYCSPCVPNAGNLDSALTPKECVAKENAGRMQVDVTRTGRDAVRTYCFGHDWFDENKAPYVVFSVATGEVVHPEVSE